MSNMPVRGRIIGGTKPRSGCRGSSQNCQFPWYRFWRASKRRVILLQNMHRKLNDFCNKCRKSATERYGSWSRNLRRSLNSLSPTFLVICKVSKPKAIYVANCISMCFKVSSDFISMCLKLSPVSRVCVSRCLRLHKYAFLLLQVRHQLGQLMSPARTPKVSNILQEVVQFVLKCRCTRS